MIKAIIFDLGGVLIDDPAQGLMAYSAQHLGVTVSALTQAFSSFDTFQKGHISEQVFWSSVCNTLHCALPRTASLWGDAFKTVYKPKPSMFQLAIDLHIPRYKTALLSNTEEPVATFVLQQQLPLFDVYVLSCREGTRKPEPLIYELTLQRLNVEASEAVFIDDRQDYLDGAKNLGIHTILFKTPQQAQRDLSIFLD